MSFPSFVLRFCASASLFLAVPAFAQSETRTRLVTSPPLTGQPITLTAEVDAPGGGKPTGTVSFTDGDQILGSAVVSMQGGAQATLTTGIGHGCALASPAGVKCWGWNRYGQLGNGSTNINGTPPSPVTGLDERVVELAAGGVHSCALTIGGGVECWGFNLNLQLGDTTLAAFRTIPAPVPNLTKGVVAISSGYYHSCAVTVAGRIVCWGSNMDYQIGNGGDQAYGVLPTPVGGPAVVYKGVAAGTWHSCGLTNAGAVLCWGAGFGKLPVAIAGVESGVVAITAGSQNCALTDAGGVKCWNSWSQQPTAVQVPGLETGVVAVSAGSRHRCALSNDGSVRCWGGNQYGQLGDGTTTDHATPTQVKNLGGFAVAVSAGWDYSCALLSPSRTVRCWGYNEVGEIGDGSTINRSLPVTVVGLSGILRGRARLTASSLAAGWHSLRANYLGDATHAGSRTAPLPLQVK